MEKEKTYDELLRELEEIRYQLEDANETINVIRSGGVDALVINSVNGHQLYKLENADVTYRTFIEQMTEGAVTLNHDGDILYCNSRFAEWVSFPLEKVIGRPFADFVHQDDHLNWQSVLQLSWANDTRAEIKLLSAGVDFKCVSLSLNVLDMIGSRSVSMIITDLTYQKAAQTELQRKNALLEKAEAVARELNINLEYTVQERTKELFNNQQQLSRILETMAEGVGITDAAGNLTYANPMAQRILGLKESEIKKRTYDDPKWQNLRVDGTPLPGSEHPMAVTLATGEPVYDFEIGVKPPDREVFYISINAAPVRDEAGTIIAGIGTFMDVTQRRHTIQQKDEFISIASHELKTPVTSLKASLQLLERMKNNPLPAMLPRLIDQSVKSLNRINLLIDDLLSATRIKEGQLVLKKIAFNVSQLVDESCRNIHTDQHIDFVTTGDSTLQVMADADKIEQVLVNFINNAVKYAPDSNQIIINYTKLADAVKVYVTDHGPGIPPEKLPHLFERYYRVDKNGHQYSGLGLGLYICSEIIKKHGGHISADSTLGVGSTFWFTLPC